MDNADKNDSSSSPSPHSVSIGASLAVGAEKLELSCKMLLTEKLFLSDRAGAALTLGRRGVVGARAQSDQ